MEMPAGNRMKRLSVSSKNKATEVPVEVANVQKESHPKAQILGLRLKNENPSATPLRPIRSAKISCNERITEEMVIVNKFQRLDRRSHRISRRAAEQCSMKHKLLLPAEVAEERVQRLKDLRRQPATRNRTSDTDKQHNRVNLPRKVRSVGTKSTDTRLKNVNECSSTESKAVSLKKQLPTSPRLSIEITEESVTRFEDQRHQRAIRRRANHERHHQNLPAQRPMPDKIIEKPVVAALQQSVNPPLPIEIDGQPPRRLRKQNLRTSQRAETTEETVLRTDDLGRQGTTDKNLPEQRPRTGRSVATKTNETQLEGGQRANKLLATECEDHRELNLKTIRKSQRVPRTYQQNKQNMPSQRPEGERLVAVKSTENQLPSLQQQTNGPRVTETIEQPLKKQKLRTSQRFPTKLAEERLRMEDIRFARLTTKRAIEIDKQHDRNVPSQRPRIERSVATKITETQQKGVPQQTSQGLSTETAEEYIRRLGDLLRPTRKRTNETEGPHDKSLVAHQPQTEELVARKTTENQQPNERLAKESDREHLEKQRRIVTQQAAEIIGKTERTPFFKIPSIKTPSESMYTSMDFNENLSKLSLISHAIKKAKPKRLPFRVFETDPSELSEKILSITVVEPKSTDFIELPTKLQITNKDANLQVVDITRFLQNCRIEIRPFLKNILVNQKQIQFNIIMQVTFIRNDIFTLHSNSIAVESSSEIDDSIDVLAELIWMKTTQLRGKLCGLNDNEFQIHHLEVQVKELPLRRGAFLPLPIFIDPTAVINVKTSDIYSFKWALISAVSPPDDSDLCGNDSKEITYRTDNITRDHIHRFGVDFDFYGLQFPHEVRYCRVFEQRNPHVSLNVFGVECSKTNASKLIGPLYRTRCEKEIHINLLYLEDERKNIFHYACITNLSKLLPRNRDHHYEYVCNTCIRQFDTENELSLHKFDKQNCDNPVAYY